MPNRLSPKGAAFVRAHEGFVSRYYLDPIGVPTIGIGFTWRSTSFREWWAKNMPGVKFGPGASMTRAQADDALIYMCEREYGSAVNQFLAKQVPQHVFDGTVSPVYNLGTGSLEWKWADAVKRGDYADAARLLRTTGTTANGKKLAGLVRRRKEEALLIEHGIYTGVGDVTPQPILDAMSDGILQRGEAGEAVARLIRDLEALGYYDGILDDLFGPGTESAVMALQRDHGLKVDGVAGPVTLGKIDTLLGKVAQPPKPKPAPTPSPAPEPAPSSPAGAVWAVLAAIVAAILFLIFGR